MCLGVECGLPRIYDPHGFFIPSRVTGDGRHSVAARTAHNIVPRMSPEVNVTDRMTANASQHKSISNLTVYQSVAVENKCYSAIESQKLTNRSLYYIRPLNTTW